MANTHSQAPTLLGRRIECEALDQLLASARAGESRSLVVRGEAGVGKTALLNYLSEHAVGCRVARVAGDESEIEFAFAGLHQLCAPMLDHLDQLPVPQREALTTAFGLSTGPTPDRFLVGLAILSLLAAVAEEQPVVCLVDDAQWLDRISVQTLAFVARRLLAEPVALVFAARPVGDDDELRGLPEQPVRGLSDGDARRLLDAAVLGPLDAVVRDRIVSETRGNPLALLELPLAFTPAELAGGFGLPGAIPLASRVEESFIRRLAPLPADTRRLMLTAAVESTGDAMLLWRAIDQLGIAADAAGAATATGLMKIGTRVRFRHPLMRSAALRAASAPELQEVHRAVAEVTDQVLDPDRRAWHRAQAAAGPDEDLAAELERSAGRAQARGGVAAGAAFLERAAELTVDPVSHAQRALAAAHAKEQAGAFDAAQTLLAAAQAGPLDELQSARAELLGGRIAMFSGVSEGAAPPLILVAAAKKLERLDLTLARDTHLDAFWAALVFARLARAVGEVATAARAAPSPATPPRPADLLLDGLALLATDGYAAGAPVMDRALSAFVERGPAEEGLRWRSLAADAAVAVWDDAAWETILDRHLELARASGALGVLPLVLTARLVLDLLAGDLTAAAARGEESRAVADATGRSLAPYPDIMLAALQGRQADVDTLRESFLAVVVPRGEGLAVTLAWWASAVCANGRGQYEQALAAAEQAIEYPQELGFAKLSLTEYIEAATRSGEPERAAVALERLTATTRPTGTDWGLGLEARSRALVSEGDVAERLYREGIERLGRTRIRLELARAHLLFGEWLRRENRRAEAREHLRIAHDRLTAMGVHAFAERARRELLATGETVRKRTAETRDDLTAQEWLIARLARDGLSNPEIGAQVFLSPRTVEWHLAKVFAKLGISSRKELVRRLSSVVAAPV